MKRISLLLILLAAVSGLWAADYFVSPGGSGLKDGSSADNALDVSGFRAAVAQAQDDDYFSLAAGLYDLSDAPVVIDCSKSIVIAGASGTERTVFSGDADGNGTADDGDAASLVRFFNLSSTNPDAVAFIQNIDFTLACARQNEAALIVEDGHDIRITKCNFYDNVADTQGAAAALVEGTAKFTDCFFSANSADGEGGIIVAGDTQKQNSVTFERCVFADNTVGGVNGGTLSVRGGKSVNLINSTLTGNQAAARGTAVCVADGCRLNVIGCTVSGSTLTGTGAASGQQFADGQIYLAQGASLYVVNSILCGDRKTAAIICDGGAVVSGGYNAVGAVQGCEPAYKSNDKSDPAYTHARYFGYEGLNNMKVMVPALYMNGPTNSYVRDFVKDFGLPTTVDLTIDQVGTERDGDDYVCNGAYAATKDEVNQKASGIEQISDDNRAGLVSKGNHIYTIAGVNERVIVLNAAGATVATFPATHIDLSVLTRGIYILATPGTHYKVAR